MGESHKSRNAFNTTELKDCSGGKFYVYFTTLKILGKNKQHDTHLDSEGK